MSRGPDNQGVEEDGEGVSLLQPTMGLGERRISSPSDKSGDDGFDILIC